MTELIDWTFTVEIDYPAEYFPMPELVHEMLCGNLLGRGLMTLERAGQNELVMFFAVAAPNQAEAESIGLNLADQALRECGLPGITTHRTTVEKDEELVDWFIESIDSEECLEPENYRRILDQWRSRYN